MDDLLDLTGRAEATHFWFHGFRSFVAPVLAAHAAGRRNLRMIDCGCGTGANLALLAPYGRAFAFDVTSLGTIRAASSGVAAVRADITRIPFASNSFDLATSFDVLQCVGEDVPAIEEMARIVKPGGTIVLTLAALEALRGDHAVVWNEARRYTPASARRLVEDAGLAVHQVSFLFASLFPLMLTVRTGQRLMQRFRPPRADSDITVPAAPINAALTWLVRMEAAIARRVPMPIGSSLLVVARKPDGTETTRRD
jgi:SAM-dependent methyltransferase